MHGLFLSRQTIWSTLNCCSAVDGRGICGNKNTMHKVLSYCFHSYKHNELFSNAHDTSDSTYFKTSHFPIISAHFGRKMCALPIAWIILRCVQKVMKLKEKIEKITASSDQGKVFSGSFFGGNGKTYLKMSKTLGERACLLKKEHACIWTAVVVFVKTFKTSNKISDSVLVKGEMDRLKI